MKLILKHLISIKLMALICVLALGVALQDSSNRYRILIQNSLFDSLNRFHPRDPGADVVILDIDEKSLDRPELGQWPWPRPIIARLIEQLNEYGAKVIGFDMVFAEADKTSPEQIMRAWKEKDVSPDVMKAMKRMESHDRDMAKIIRRVQNVVLGLNFESLRRSGGFGFTPRPKVDVEIGDISNLDGYIYPFDTVANYPILSRFAYGEGHFYAVPDYDGVYRRVPMVIGIKKKNIRKDADKMGHYFFYPSLTAEVLRYILDTKTVKLTSKHNETLVIGEGNNKFDIPVSSEGQFYVWYAKPVFDWYISAHDVLSGKVDSQRLKDKVVLVGTSAIGLKDIRSTPMGPNRPGVEVHLNIVDQVLNGQFLQRPEHLKQAEIVILIMLGLFMFYAAFRYELLGQSFMFLGAFSLVMIASWVSYVSYGVLFDGLYIALVLFSLYVFAVVMSYISSEQDRQKIRDAFGHYISPSYMKELTQNPNSLKLGGQEKVITTLFSDIRGFTGLSEGMSPDALISLMNDFLTPLSDAIMERRGTIDKYMGDAIMAFWNAPIDDDLHAYNACLTALDMQERLHDLNDERRSIDESVSDLLAGIGINSGYAAVGNMGSEQRFAYSVLGDSVNLASRLESQTKTYGVDILVGEDTLMEERVKELALIEVDYLRVKGRDNPVRIYALLGDESLAENDAFFRFLTSHIHFLEAYRNQDWEEAERSIDDCISFSEELSFNLAALYNLYSERLSSHREAPPSEGWDGVHTADSK